MKYFFDCCYAVCGPIEILTSTIGKLCASQHTVRLLPSYFCNSSGTFWNWNLPMTNYLLPKSCTHSLRQTSTHLAQQFNVAREKKKHFANTKQFWWTKHMWTLWFRSAIKKRATNQTFNHFIGACTRKTVKRSIDCNYAKNVHMHTSYTPMEQIKTQEFSAAFVLARALVSLCVCAFQCKLKKKSNQNKIIATENSFYGNRFQCTQRMTASIREVRNTKFVLTMNRSWLVHCTLWLFHSIDCKMHHHRIFYVQCKNGILRIWIRCGSTTDRCRSNFTGHTASAYIYSRKLFNVKRLLTSSLNDIHVCMAQ